MRLCGALQVLTPPTDHLPWISPLPVPSSSFWEGSPLLLTAAGASPCALKAVPLCPLRSEPGSIWSVEMATLATPVVPPVSDRDCDALLYSGASAEFRVQEQGLGCVCCALLSVCFP